MKSPPITLIRTPQGYSLLDGETEVNRSSNKPIPNKSYVQKKYAQQNFTIYPYIDMTQDHHKYMVMPARAQWFNINSVHELQKKALPEWFKIKKGILATMNNTKFEKHQQLYKKYRNHIISLAQHQYLTPSQGRKGLAGDACSIIRIHQFLQKWGLINYLHPKPNKKQPVESQRTRSLSTAHKTKRPGEKRKDCFDKDKLIISRSYGKDDLQLLKKITKKYRPICHFCEGIVGIVWYEYQQLSYQFLVCANCFYEGNIPVILSHSNFVKKSILDNLPTQVPDQNDKKKTAEQNKIVDHLQKNKFNLKKCSHSMKMDVDHLYKLAMLMPIQKLEKLARIDLDTSDEEEGEDKNKQTSKEKEKSKSKNKETQQCKQSKEVKENKQKIPNGHSLIRSAFQTEIQTLSIEHRMIYQQFLQAWLLKIQSKMDRLTEWQNGTFSKLASGIRLQKNNLATKLQNQIRGE